MSLLEWKKLAKQKTELGNKINFVHDTILKKQLGEKISQESFQKAFKPITTKLDDVAFRNLNIPRLTKKRGKKLDVPDYGIALEDEDIPDYGLDDFFDEGLVPENEKQIVPKPPTYEESLKDILEGEKQIYVNPQYFPEEPQDMPPEYEEDEEIDYALDEEDSANMILDELELSNYDDIEKQINQPEMTQRKIKKYVNNEQTERTAKGIKKQTIKKDIRHEDYKHVLFNNEQIHHKMKTIRSEKHLLGSYELNKISLSCFDDKRFIHENGITSHAYGHYQI